MRQFYFEVIFDNFGLVRKFIIFNLLHSGEMNDMRNFKIVLNDL